MKIDPKIYKISAVVCSILAIIFIFWISLRCVQSHDIWTDLAVGKNICKTLSIPTSEIFSFSTDGENWVPESWLYQVSVFLCYKVVGFDGITIVKALLLASLMFLLVRFFYSRRWNLCISGIVVSWFVFVFNDLFLIRAQTVSFVLFLFNVTLLLKFRETKKNKYLFYFPVIHLLWVNVHPSFVIGILVMLIFLVAEWAKKILRFKFRRWFGYSLKVSALLWLTVSVCSCVAVSLINPYGVDVYQNAFRNVDVTALFSVMEWNTFEWVLLMNIPALILPIFTILCFFFVPARRRDLTDIILLLVLFLPAYFLKRYTIYPFLISVIFIVKYASYMVSVVTNVLFLDRRTGRLWGLNLVGVVSILSVVAIIVTSVYSFDQAVYPLCGESRLDFYPKGVTEYIKNNPVERNVYAPYFYSGYMLFQLYPEYKNFFDYRTLRINKHPIIDDLKIRNARVGWVWLAEKYNINTILIRYNPGKNIFSTKNTVFRAKIAQSPDWRLVYWDDENLLYSKTPYELDRRDKDKLYLSVEPENLKMFLDDDPVKVMEIKKELLRRKREGTSSAWCNIFLGVLEIKNKNIKQGRDYLNIAVDLKPKDPKIRCFKSVLEWQENGASEPLENYVDGFDSDFDTKIQSAFYLILMDLYSGALRILNNLKEVFPEKMEPYLLSGICKDKLGDYPNALVDFQKAVNLEPSNPETIYYLAKCYVNNEIWDQASRNLIPVIEKERNNYLYWFLIAQSNFYRGRIDDALFMCRTAVQLRPHHFDSWLLAGELYRLVGRSEDSVVVLKKALVINPVSQKATLELAITYMEMKDYDNAEKYLQRAQREFFAENPKWLFSKARLSALKNNIADSYKYLNDIEKSLRNEYKKKISSATEFKDFLTDQKFKDFLDKY